MLARSAQGLYWMSRYLERVEALCRLLKLQTELLTDRPIREIRFGWKRIYAALDASPPVGGFGVQQTEDYALADSYTLADDLTFERLNPSSVWSSLAMGRENARQMRHCINAEMWMQLNLTFLRLQKMRIEDIWATSPESFYSETATEIDTFAGVAAATMYRDEGWRFLQLGRSVERAQFATALLLAQIELDDETEDYFDADWTSLLRLYNAFEVYNRRYSVEVEPQQVLDLLATDTDLPDSLIRSLDRIVRVLSAIGAGPDARSSDSLQRLAGRVAALVRYDWVDNEDHHALLLRVNENCLDLHNRIAATYFDYQI